MGCALSKDCGNVRGNKTQATNTERAKSDTLSRTNTKTTTTTRATATNSVTVTARAAPELRIESSYEARETIRVSDVVADSEVAALEGELANGHFGENALVAKVPTSDTGSPIGTPQSPLASVVASLGPNIGSDWTGAGSIGGRSGPEGAACIAGIQINDRGIGTEATAAIDAVANEVEKNRAEIFMTTNGIWRMRVERANPAATRGVAMCQAHNSASFTKHLISSSGAFLAALFNLRRFSSEPHLQIASSNDIPHELTNYSERTGEFSAPESGQLKPSLEGSNHSKLNNSQTNISDSPDSREMSTPTTSNLLHEKELATKFSEISKRQSLPIAIHNWNQAQDAQENRDEIQLFTCIQELCYKIISEQLLKDVRKDDYNQSSDKALVKAQLNYSKCKDEGKVLCLFVFGRQGSSKGELSFELVQHSPLLGALPKCQSSPPTRGACIKDSRLDQDDKPDELEHFTTTCPLYCQLDVAAIIVANIDARIREYNHLVAQALQNRRQQMKDLEVNSSSTESKTSENNNFDIDREFGDQRSFSSDNEDDFLNKRQEQKDREGRGKVKTELIQRNRKLLGDSFSSSASSSCNSITNDRVASQESTLSKIPSSVLQDDSGLVTLSTKQRSVLQLKLMKYFNSITSKWIFGLIQAEIDKLELRFKRSLETQSAKQKAKDRVYLINLVPNQLSLFKSCLYLQQNMHLKKFEYPYWGIKFERRTNIRLLSKEQRKSASSTSGADKLAGSRKKSDSKGGSELKSGALRLIRLSIWGSGAGNDSSSLERASSAPSLSASSTRKDGNSSNSISLSSLVSDLSGSSEKLIPKFNENFAQQFREMGKLIQVRYNATRNYNYANQDPNSESDDESGVEKSSQVRLDTTLGPHLSSTSCPTSSNRFGCNKRHLSCSSLLTSRLDGINLNVNAFKSPSSETLNLAPGRPSEQPASLLSASSSMQDLHHRGSISVAIPAGDHNPESRLDKQRNSTSHQLSSVLSPPPIPIARKLSAPTPCRATSSSSISVVTCSSGHTGITGSGTDADSAATLLGHHSRRSVGSPRVAPWPNSGHSLGPLKWAIELSLFDNTDGQSANARQDTVLFVYDPPKTSRSPLSVMFVSSSSKSQASTIEAAAPGIQRPEVTATSKNRAAYHLMATRIAYANGQSQMVFEARRFHNRSLKLEKLQNQNRDVTRLAKLISKARKRLTSDLQGWLLSSIAARHQASSQSTSSISSSFSSLCSSSEQQRVARTLANQLLGPSDVGPSNRKRVSITSSQEALVAALQPALAVYTIRLDVSRLMVNVADQLEEPTAKVQVQTTPTQCEKTTQSTESPPHEHGGLQLGVRGQSQLQQQSQQKPLVPILTVPSVSGGGANIRPKSATFGPQMQANMGHNLMLNVTGSKNAQTRVCSASERPKRHVQFRLSQAPSSNSLEDKQHQQENQLFKSHWRQWVGESLFISADEVKTTKLMPILVKLVNSAEQRCSS